jgi:Bacterial Ig-like domain (group 1)
MISIVKWVAAIATAVGISACGGGGGDAGTTPFGSGSGSGGGGGSGGTSGQPSIALSLSTNTVTAATPATATATVLNASGAAVAGQVVAFSTAGGLGTFSSASALTDSNGKAVVALYPAPSATTGADQVVATSTLNGAALTASQGFQLSASSVSITAFTSDIGANSLSAYGQTNLTITIAGAAAGTPVTTTISSVCVSKGKATLVPSSATTTNGIASFTYKDQGCGATDTADSLQAALTGSASTSTLSLKLTSPLASSLSFVSASPEVIYLKGSGFAESSTVTFQVLDIAGNPLPNQPVTLAATTQAGGLALDPASIAGPKFSDSTGRVSAIVNSGTVPTPVRVQASTVVGTTSISTVSSSLSVAVGLPSQLNFSLSQGTFNIEGFDIDGTPNTYNIIASDRLSNPVPAGTSINFVAEGGQVQGIKQIALVNGLARTTANFISASPRPANGRITIVAYALGEESFIDANGNNVYDCGESFQDLGDIYIDRAFNGTFDSADDQFISLSTTNSSACSQPVSNPDSPLLGLGVSIPSVTASNVNGAKGPDGIWGRAYVRRAAETVLSTSAARPVWTLLQGGITSGSSVSLATDASGVPTTFIAVGSSALQVSSAEGSLRFLISDANPGVPASGSSPAIPGRLNPMAAGTTLTGTTTTDGWTISASGGPVPSTLSAPLGLVDYKFDPTKPNKTATVQLSITSPSGLKTDLRFSLVYVGP